MREPRTTQGAEHEAKDERHDESDFDPNAALPVGKHCGKSDGRQERRERDPLGAVLSDPQRQHEQRRKDRSAPDAQESREDPRGDTERAGCDELELRRHRVLPRPSEDRRKAGTRLALRRASRCTGCR